MVRTIDSSSSASSGAERGWAGHERERASRQREASDPTTTSVVTKAEVGFRS